MGRRRGRNRPGGLLGLAERAGISRGLFGNSKGWLYVGTGLWTLRKVRTMAARKSEVLVSEPLKPGQRLIISNGRATVDGDALAFTRGRGGRLKPAKAPKAAKPAKVKATKPAKAAKA